MFDPIEQIAGGEAAVGAAGSITDNSMMGKEEFLNLLVTQIQHQDPLDPMDNEQFVAQMAQFSSLEQLMNMNETMGNIQMLETSINNSQAVDLIGKNITVRGKSIQMREGGSSPMTFTVTEDAKQVGIRVFDENGILVRTVNLGEYDTGRHDFKFDGMNDWGEMLPDGDYTFDVDAKTREGDTVPVTTLSNVKVDGIVYDQGNVWLLAGSSRFMMSDITEVRGMPQVDVNALMQRAKQELSSTNFSGYDSGQSAPSSVDALF